MVHIVYHGFFVGWGTLALLNAAIAQLQGRNTILWFFISLLIGPLATLLLLIMHMPRS